MTVRVALRHRTRYVYDRPIRLGPQVVRLRPAPHSRSKVTSFSIDVAPKKHFQNWQQDPHGNWLLRLVFPEPTRELSLDVDLVAELEALNPFEFFLEPEADFLPFEYDAETAIGLGPYLKTSAGGPLLDELVRELRPNARRTVDFLVELNRLVHERTRYLIRLEPGVQTPDETLEKKSGSCRDSAWLLVQILRRLGLAARFASGYLIQLKPDVKPLEGPPGPDADFTDLHAWAEVYLPGAGWIGLDATSGLLTAEGHVPLACTPEPASAAPLSGVLDECESVLHHEMQVARVYESPRVTLPYTDSQWRAIEALGTRVDEDLARADVRLTMGGEPTFVSIDDMDGHEWTYGALGEHKRKLAGDLFRRLAKRFAKGPLLHYGQGKWYPGEQLPRWALGCYFRADGEPIWGDEERYAKDGVDDGMTSEHAAAFVRALAGRIGVTAEHAEAGYEDAFHYMLRERKLPVNVDVLDSRVEDELERARIARVFERGLKHVVGHALPLRALGQGRWQSGPWFL
ncbi:MAG TPA: transglutaminase family protein, partial [Polyangiaceae bacterium]